MLKAAARLLLLITLLPGCALASAPLEAQSAYQAGQYEKAATLAEAQGTGEALAFAAQARIADAITRSEGFCEPCLRQAEALAERAITVSPDLVDGYLQSAVAMGFRARVIGISEAQNQSLASKAKARLDKALILDPSNFWARSSLGAWHLEIVHHAGPVLAAITFGASRERGLELYRGALKDAADNATLHYHYALSILALDQSGLQTEAIDVLTATQTMPEPNALAQFVKQHAATLLKALQHGSRGEVSKLVKQLQGYR